METLVDRRAALCLSVAKKAYKSEKFSDWFTESETDLQLAEVKVRTARYWKSSLPHLTDLLNNELRK
jgi:cellulase/cellobiase CelA1